jgi:hypothetical protein
MPEVVVTPQAPVTPPPAAPAAAPSAPRRYEIPAFADETVDAVTPAPAEGVKPAQDTGDQATPPKTEGDTPKEEVVTPEQAAKREGRRFERKLDKAYRQRAEAQARADLLEKRLAALEQPKAPEGEPKLEQFDYDPEKYAQAVAEFRLSKAEKERATKQREETIKQTQERLVSSWEEKAEKGLDKYADWNDVVGEIKPGTAMADAIMGAENGDDVAYYIGKHPKEMERIASLPWFSQIREIGKLEAKLLSTPEKPKAPSKAPAPITPLTGAASVASNEPSDQDDTATWIRKRNKQVHGKR